MLFNTTVRVKSYQFLHIKSKPIFRPSFSAPLASLPGLWLGRRGGIGIGGGGDLDWMSIYILPLASFRSILRFLPLRKGWEGAEMENKENVG